MLYEEEAGYFYRGYLGPDLDGITCWHVCCRSIMIEPAQLGFLH